MADPRRLFAQFVGVDASRCSRIFALIHHLATGKDRLRSLCQQIDVRLDGKRKHVAPFFVGRGFKVVFNLGEEGAPVDSMMLSPSTIGIWLGVQFKCGMHITGRGAIAYAIPHEVMAAGQDDDVMQQMHAIDAEVLGTLEAEVQRNAGRLH